MRSSRANEDGGAAAAAGGGGAPGPGGDRDGHLRRGAGRDPALARGAAPTAIDLVLPLGLPEERLREMLEAAAPR